MIEFDSNVRLSDMVYDGLLTELQTFKLIPGMIIDRKAIARQYNVSIAPVHDAVQRLAMDGYLEIRSRSITIVKNATKEELYGTWVLRLALEAQIARLICGEIVQSRYDELMEKAKDVDSQAGGGNFWVAETEFHKFLAGLTNCKQLMELHKSVINLRNFIIHNSSRIRILPSGVKCHETLIDELRNPDQDHADAVMRKHVGPWKSEL